MNTSSRRITWILVIVGVCAMGALLGLVLWQTLNHSPQALLESAAEEPADDPSDLPEGTFSQPEPVSGNYVGSTACRECHADVYREYQGHPMAHSLAHVADAEPIEDYRNETQFSPLSRVSYRVVRQGERVFHHERLVDSEGREIYDQGVEVEYAVGSGRDGRTYLINRDGRLFESPITWYTHGDEWGLSPGYQPEGHPRFERPALGGCLACHAGRMAVDETNTDRFDPEQPFLEKAVGCERCHGPGGEHIRYHKNVQIPTDQDDPIVNPEDLDPARRNAVCFQCHLQGEQRVLRYGRTNFDFRPGMALSDVWVTFLKSTGPPGQETTVVTQVEQMLASGCYEGTGGRLGCVSCHDPHRVPEPANKIAFYRSRCLQCHQQNGEPTCALPESRRLSHSAEDSCISCHMPVASSKRVPHTARSDHRIPRFGLEEFAPAKSGPSERAEFDYASGTHRLFEEPGFELPEPARRRARGIFIADKAHKKQDVGRAFDAWSLLRPVLKAIPRDPATADAAGRALFVLGQHADAREVWKKGLEKAPTDEGLLVNLAMHYQHYADDLQTAREYYERLVEVNPFRASYYKRYAQCLAVMGDYESSIRACRKTLELDPSEAQVHLLLSQMYQAVGNEKLSRKHAETAQRIHASRDGQGGARSRRY